MYKITHANIKEWAANYDGPLFDGILCDPPYELGFMGKSWDSSGIAFDTEMWADLFKLVKPGGHLLAFSGSRTYHRMAVAIEDAGFEIRDMIEWVYGSGFPKSLNIGKAVDKINGEDGRPLKFVEWYRTTGMKQKQTNEIIGKSDVGSHYLRKDQPVIPTAELWRILRPHIPIEIPQWVDELVDRIEKEREIIGKHETDMGGLGGERLGEKGGDITKGNSPYEGYGTALKPAHESICVAHKPLETCTEIEYITSICQTLFVEIAKESSGCNLSDKTQQGIAQWTAEKNISTLADLLEVMDMLQSLEKDNTNLSIVLSWLNTLAESWQVSNTYTTSTKLNMITELRILDSLEWGNILPSITQAKSNPTGGLSADAYNAASLLNAVKLKLHDTLTRSANVSATFSENPEDLRPSHEPICLARKPIEGTVANNVLKHGTGGLNIDGSRVQATKEDMGDWDRFKGHQNSNTIRKNMVDTKTQDFEDRVDNGVNTLGRFPSNFIHDGSDEVEAVFPQTKNGGGNSTSKRETWLRQETEPTQYAGDKGSASRFFYTAKASKSERNAGLDELPDMLLAHSNQAKAELKRGNTDFAREVDTSSFNSVKMLKNHHPTVKPLSLTKYLATLIKPPTGGRLLVPFSGSGSEMIGALQAGWEYVEGVELTEEYIPIAEARIAHWIKIPVQETLGV